MNVLAYLMIISRYSSLISKTMAWLTQCFFKNCPCMENCESGCPCNGFDCNLSLNVTDPVIGLEHLGIFETTGKKYS